MNVVIRICRTSPHLHHIFLKTIFRHMVGKYISKGYFLAINEW